MLSAISMPLRFLFALGALLLLLPACDVATSTPDLSPIPQASPLPLGDPCLIGTWTLLSETSLTPTVSISGLSGARMTITADGLETTDYAGAAPETGTADASPVVITLHGQWSFQDHTALHLLYRTAVHSALVEAVSVNGGSPSSSLLHQAPLSSFTYACNTTQLTLHTSSTDGTGSFSDIFSRAS
jgi:hypothetical protein